MKVALTATWDPRGEMPRLRRLLPELMRVYANMVLILPPGTGMDLVGELRMYPDRMDWLHLDVSPEWSWGRYLALKEAAQLEVDFVQYADLDRLLRWVETRPEEWRKSLQAIEGWDCLVFGRTPESMNTHPQAILQTEAISNRIVSYFLGQPVDISAGSKVFSIRAATFLEAYTSPGRALGADAEWTILVQRAGMRVGFLEVDGLDWETADRYQLQAASNEQQRQTALAYDDDPQHWTYRVGVASEIVDVALDTIKKPLPQELDSGFDPKAVFDVDDYMYFYEDDLKPEVADKQVDFLQREIGGNGPVEILDLACGFGRHANRLAALGHRVTGIDLMPEFIKIARLDAKSRDVTVNYRQGDMRLIEFDQCFDAALLMFTTFGYFDDDENEQVLKRIARSLRAGGLLVIDTRNRDEILKSFLPYVVTEKEGNLMIDRLHFDSQKGRLYNRRIIIRNGVRKDKPFFVRLYNPNEIGDLLQRVGMRLIQIYGGWDNEPFSADTRRMIVIAKKESLEEK